MKFTAISAGSLVSSTQTLLQTHHEYIFIHACFGFRLLHFPRWTWTEITQLHRFGFPQLELTHVFALFQKWGGVPRNVLTHHDPDGDWQASLLRALDSIDIGAFKHLMDYNALSDGMFCNRIFHLCVVCESPHCTLKPSRAGFYAMEGIELCSDICSQYVAQNIARSSHGKAIELLGICESSPLMSVFGGHLLESMLKKELMAGSTAQFVVRRLSDSDASADSFSFPSSTVIRALETFTPETLTLALEKKRSHIPSMFLLNVQVEQQLQFQTIEGIQHQLNALQFPVAKNFCAIDFIMPGLLPVNVTNAQSHKLVLSGVQNRGYLEISKHIRSLKRSSHVKSAAVKKATEADLLEQQQIK
jgi:hypothetical protein